MANEKKEDSDARRKRLCVLNFRRYRAKNRAKHRARKSLDNAVRRGNIQKSPICQLCWDAVDSIKIHGHHQDYSKPREVVWLCRSCHVHVHKKRAA